eukprot:TRINITY_DN19605_c0_g1_i1.p1 TRINITY_DN19605_c0_g1~~TRINITY_DN19605_c0_g1_i1.p1  ORF type:complete len:189 (+),score=75.89 TRINITY_DN19605_c0_g1_i1:64-567(+)
MQPTFTERKLAEEKKLAEQKAKRKREEERMLEMAAKLAAAQKAIADRTRSGMRKVNEDEQQARQKFVDVDAEDEMTSEHRKAKRSKIEHEERRIKEKRLQDAIRRRQHWEDSKTQDCGDWKRGCCDRGDGCKFKHTPKDHPRFGAFVQKHGREPHSLLEFLDFEGVQ